MKRVFTGIGILMAAVSLTAAEWVVTENNHDQPAGALSDGAGQQARRADIAGTWSARTSESRRDGQLIPQLQLQMSVDEDNRGRNGWSNWGQSVPLSAFTNLPANLDAPQDVTFELRRDAGTIVFEGRFAQGRGIGHLFFTANREFEKVMEQQTRDTFTDRELLSFALLDVSRAFVNELQSLGYKDVTLEDAHKLRIHGTTTDFIRGIRSAGYQSVSLDEILKLRIHGVSTQYIANMKAEGLQNPSLDDVLKFRIHGVTGDYVKEMRAAGLGTDLDDILQMKIHGVTPAFAKEMRALAGNRAMDAGDIKQMRIHGVTPEYVRGMKDAGFDESLDSLKQARIHGVTPAFAREMASLGYKLDFDDLRTFRIHGVSAAFVREMAGLGYKNIDADTLVKFRIHGITPAFVKQLKDAGYTNLSEDELVDWAIHGRRLLKTRRDKR